jgi:hypothetical protein
MTGSESTPATPSSLLPLPPEWDAVLRPGPHGGGKQVVVAFPNGYGASIVNYGYGSHHGLYEVAVVRGTLSGYDLCYDTPITDDVLGTLTPEQVMETLHQIAALPSRSLPSA